jgi:hypothetical protein
VFSPFKYFILAFFSSTISFGLTSPSFGLVNLIKIVAISFKISHVWNALLFSIKYYKCTKCWHQPIASGMHCQIYMIFVIYNICIVLTFLAGMFCISSVNVLLRYISYVYSSCFPVMLVSLFVELFWVCVNDWECFGLLFRPFIERVWVGLHLV